MKFLYISQPRGGILLSVETLNDTPRHSKTVSQTSHEVCCDFLVCFFGLNPGDSDHPFLEYKKKWGEFFLLGSEVKGQFL